MTQVAGSQSDANGTQPQAVGAAPADPVYGMIGGDRNDENGNCNQESTADRSNEYDAGDDDGNQVSIKCIYVP